MGDETRIKLRSRGHNGLGDAEHKDNKAGKQDTWTQTAFRRSYQLQSKLFKHGAENEAEVILKEERVNGVVEVTGGSEGQSAAANQRVRLGAVGVSVSRDRKPE